MFKRIFLIGLSFSSTAFAVKSQCIQGVDWIHFCGRLEAPGIRCLMINNSGAADFCAPETVGCAEIGGCFGDVPPGYWYPVMENNIPYRCRCGCVAAVETSFDTSMGVISGSELYARKAEADHLVSTIDSIDAPWMTSPKPVNELMAAKSEEESLFIVTRSGRSVIASPGHPVLLVDANGSPALMKKASDLQVGEHVLTIDGDADEVVRITAIDYKGDLMNFNVMSNNSAEHIVPMNGILLGDYAWQERLNSRDSRVLLRAKVAQDLMKKEFK